MKTVYEVKENNAAELLVTVDGQQWADAQKAAKNKAARNLEIPGFRKGHVPGAMVNRYLNQEAVRYQAAEDVAQTALEAGLAEYPEIRLVDRPSLDFNSVTEEEATLKFVLTIYPTVTVGDYKSIKYFVKKTQVTKNEVEAEVKSLLAKEAEEVLKEEGTVENGNIAVIDFEGFVDGVAFDGGKGTDYPLEIGSGSFIPGFEEQLVGMAQDETKDINVTFPHEYAPELADKDATFKVTVKGIKEKKVPELTDEVVADLAVAEDVKTVEDLNKHIKAQIKDKKTKENEETATNNLLTALVDVCPVEIPEIMITNEVEDTYNNYGQRLSQQGIDMDLYFQITGLTEESFKASLREEAEKKVRVRLVLEAVGKDLGITATEEEIEAKYADMASQYGMEVEQVKNLVPAEYLSDDVVMEKTLETLKTNKED